MATTIIGKSKPVIELKKMIDTLAKGRTNVLIIGESGTGKELVARSIHELGPHADQPFVAVNCGAIPENLIESELFGHKKGSFTGAVNDKDGLFKVAHGGTLFLDEVGELPLSMQVKLLRAIQDKSIRPVGGTETIHVDVRIISATNRDLEKATQKGEFREDLYYRLNVILVSTPPLRDRGKDVEELLDYFLDKFNKKFNKKIKGFSDDVMNRILDYPWPGNVRELENVVERASTMESSDQISVDSLPPSIQSFKKKEKIPSVSTSNEGDEVFLKVPVPDFSKGPVDLDEVLGNIERIYLEKALSESKGVKKNAADLLGITFRSMRYRVKKLGITSSDK